jgi:exopolysaccharide biosynthesis polyprenyl glycosylphosphotransferase
MRGGRIQPLSVALFVSDLLLVLVGLIVASELRSLLPIGRGGALSDARTVLPWPVYLIALACWGLGMLSSGVYDPQRALRWFNEAWRVVWGAGLATILMAGVLYMTYRQLSRLQFVYFFVITVGLLLAYRAGLRLSFRVLGRGRPGARTRILVLGAGDLGQRVGKLLLDHSRWGFDLLGFLDDDPSKTGQQILGKPIHGTIDNLGQIAEHSGTDEVWIALPVQAYDRLRQIVAMLERQPLRIKVVPDYFSMALVRASAEILAGIPIIGLRDPLIEGAPRLIKRAFDLLTTAILMVLALPLMLLVGILIRLDSSGPVLLRQNRVGENGRVFSMYKFRTMLAGAEGGGERRLTPDEGGRMPHKTRSDPRVTRVGRLLRRYSLDELPQLFNVLKGEMSLVGPRPEMPWLVDRYEPWQRKRFAVPQGITGWWQINGRSDKPMHLNTEDDLYYVYNYSPLLDLWILLRTPLAVIRGKGAF